MSLYLAFWRQNENHQYPKPTEVYNSIFEVGGPEKLGLEKLPHDEIVNDLKSIFKGWTNETNSADQIDFVSKDQQKSVVVGWQGSIYVAQCSFSLSKDELNSVIDVFNKYGCALYDVQTSERFFQPEPTS